jgi:hypothetical protein
MIDNSKVRQAAEQLIERDELDAIRVAMSGANACAFFGDREGARAWVNVAETVAGLISHASDSPLGETTETLSED